MVVIIIYFSWEHNSEKDIFTRAVVISVYFFRKMCYKKYVLYLQEENDNKEEN